MSYYTAVSLPAGKPGTDKWIKKYGKALVCVRCNYDLQNHRKLKTVELIVEEEPWDKDQNRIPANKIVGVKVLYGEVDIARLVRAAGGTWNRKKRLWQLPYLEVINLGLEYRMEAL